MQLGPFEPLSKSIEFKVFVVDNTWNDPLIVLEVKDEKFELLTIKLSQADIDVSLDCCHLEGGLRCICWKDNVGEK